MSEKVSDKIQDKVQKEVFEGYGGEEQRLYSYSTLMGLFNLIFAVFLLLVRARDEPSRSGWMRRTLCCSGWRPTS